MPIPDTSENTVKTEGKVKPRNKKGFREPTSLHVDPKLWQEVRVMAMLKNVSVTVYFESALRKQIDEDNREAGKQGYKIGHGGMYIPPPPAPIPQQSQQPSSDYRIRGAVEEFIEAAKEANPELYKVFEQRIKQEAQSQPPPVPSQQQPQQPQESTVDPYPNPEYNPILLNIYMPKTKYPTTKNEILELPGWKLAQRIEEFLHNELGYSVDNRLLRETAIMNKCTYDLIKIIPNKKYNTKQELQNTVREVYNKNDNELKQIHGGKDALSVNISDYTPDLGDNENEITKKFYESLNEGEKELIRGLKSPTL